MQPSYTTVKIELEIELWDEDGKDPEAVTRIETIVRIERFIEMLKNSAEGDERIVSFQIVE